MFFILHEGSTFSLTQKIQGLQPFGSLQESPSPWDGTKTQPLRLFVSSHLLHNKSEELSCLVDLAYPAENDKTFNILIFQVCQYPCKEQICESR